MECWICGSVFDIEDYGEGECPTCGQEYQYDEGHQINLTDKQLTILKNDLNQRIYNQTSEPIKEAGQLS